jgi:SAM-dependent methyltransferase
MPQAAAEFDAYDAALERGVRLSGEDSLFFARGRVAWLAARLSQFSAPCRTLLDYGCGTGSSAPLLLELPGAERLIGTDVSVPMVEIARREHGSERAEFMLPDEVPSGCVDLAYCNGVFHHVSLRERPAAVDRVHRALRPGGLFAFWENNPWNPGTRLVMRAIPFDRDAEMLSASQARGLLRAGGFETVRTDFLFIFPRMLRGLRFVELSLSRLPLGAQYLVLARKFRSPPSCPDVPAAAAPPHPPIAVRPVVLPPQRRSG